MFVSVHKLYKSMRSLTFTVKVDPQKWMSSAKDFGSPEDFESEEIGVTLKTWQSFEEHEAWRLLFL